MTQETALAITASSVWWQFGMLLIAPLMLGSGARLRVWLVMVASSLFASLVPYAPAWMGLDLLAGWLVMRRPAGEAQRFIGLLFAAMAMFDIGFIIGGGSDRASYTGFLACLGWVQFLVLLIWGFHDHFGHRFRLPWGHRAQAAHRPGA